MFPKVLPPSEPVIKEEVPREKLQTADIPSDNVLLQERCQAIIDELNHVKIDDSVQNPSELKSALAESDKSGLQPKPLKVSEIDPEQMAQINYMTMLEEKKYNQEYRQNLDNLMNMGFMDFPKNLILL